MTVAGALIGFVLLIGIFCLFLRIWRSRRRRRNLSFSWRRRDPSAVFATQDDFIAEDHGPVIDHPIWYIHTVGLEQSIIESIAVFRYKKEDKLIEGTDCSVCLSEFEEDESLRLLPKCSHAFHIPCIDTWLRSHKNCPLCRAPIVAAAANSGAVAVQAAAAASGSSTNLNSGEDSPVENLEPTILITATEENEEGREDDEARIGSGGSSNNEVDLSDHSKRLMVLLRRSHSRVPSDVLEGGRREGAGDLQGVRRSLSLDSSSAMAIYRAVENIEVEEEGEGKNLVARELKSCTKSRNGGKRGTSLSFRKLMKSGSIIGLQKGPVLMKRSNSSSKASTSRHGGRSHDSILPL
ncbi:unnamed protein product [Linum tenue]|uniref:RING-type E3 ubiquitin transferase n=1 Tax=Linum tenue TaxID=586396 RepID=A0AAV0KMC9_9ROSI|nr:unnamed protein product [Linum tenue]